MSTESDSLTKFHDYHTSYKWTVENWRASPQFVQWNKDGSSGEILSPMFSGKDGSKWQLAVYFKKSTRYTNEVFRAMRSSLIYRRHAKQNICFGVTGYMELKTLHDDGFKEMKKEFDVFLSREDKTCAQMADVDINTIPSSFHFSADLTIGGIADTTFEKDLPLPTTGESSKIFFQSNFSALADDDEFADVTVAVEDSEFRAHKAVLAARSSVFRTMLSSEMREKEDNRIVMTDVTAMAWKVFQQFLYTNALHLPENYSLPFLFELLMLSDKYDVRALSESVEVELIQKMSQENILEICEVLEKYEMPQVRAAAVKIITQNWEEMKKDKRMISLIAGCSELAFELFGKLIVN